MRDDPARRSREPLKLTSCLSEDTYPICRSLATYLSHQLDAPVEFITPEPWQLRAELLAKGDLHLGWICGLLYRITRERDKAPLQPLVAPVMIWPRYQDRPIYFSDIVVRQDSPFHTFADLQGARFAYNEPGSFSGYAIVRHHLAMLGQRSGYFQLVVESGSHQESLKMVLAGHVDAAAIDSIALDLAAQSQPNLREQVRTVELLGPNPAPPLVISNLITPTAQQNLQAALLTLGASGEGRMLLKRCHLSRFVAVKDEDYDQISHVALKAEQASL